MSLRDYMQENLFHGSGNFDKQWDKNSTEMLTCFLDHRTDVVSLNDYYSDEYQNRGFEEFSEMTEFYDSIKDALYEIDRLERQCKQDERILTIGLFSSKIINEIKEYLKNIIEQKWEYMLPEITRDIHESRLDDELNNR